MLRRSFLWQSLSIASAAASAAAATQRPAGVARLGVLLYDDANAWEFFVTELRTELAAVGWTDAKNLIIDWRYAKGDPARLRVLASELVASRPDAIVTRGTPATQALQRATTTIPILTGVGDPIGAGIARSYAAPGANITGICWGTVEASVKHVEILRALVPRLATLRLVVPADRAPFLTDLTRPLEIAARDVGLVTEAVKVESVAELEPAFRLHTQRGVIGAFVYGFPQIDPRTIIGAALAASVPTMSDNRRFVELGGLACYRLNWDNQTQRAVAQIDKVLRGENPARIPFELPTRSELALNKSTARTLGLTIPQSLLLRADIVVE